MGTLKSFAADLRLATADLEPAAVAGALAAYAEAELAAAIASGAASPRYDRFVNGRLGAPEESVEAPGPILYLFNAWGAAIPAIIEFLVKRSPERSGAYKRDHQALVDWARVAPEAIPQDAEVIITNTRPYTRKIEAGHMQMTVPHGVYEDAYQFARRNFGGPAGFLDVGMKYLVIPGGYVLRGRYRRGYRTGARKGIRKDTAKDQPLTYPSLVLRTRDYA